MNRAWAVGQRWISGYVADWNRFWFQPRLPHTLCALRIVTGVMLTYSHLVLATDLESFLGPDAWIDNETAVNLHDGTFGVESWSRSYLWHIDDLGWLWAHHLFAISVSFLFAAGLLTRIAAPLAWFLQLMYLHRLTGALFGFDQIVTYATMYLAFTPCGSCLSIDAILRRRFASRLRSHRLANWLLPLPIPSMTANLATRLFQVHLCVIYLFGGLAKARGQTWWDGTAMWYSIANYEYQSIDMTWMARYPRIFTAMSHATLFWEIFYCALVWPRRTRPFVLAAAVAVHGGIAAFLGMITFGVMMITANMIFVPPAWLARRLGDDVASDLATGERSESTVSNPLNEAIAVDLQSDEATSVPLENADARQADLERREDRLRRANRRLQAKKLKLRERETTYRERVGRLKERESKIRRLIERRRATREQQQPPES